MVGKIECLLHEQAEHGVLVVDEADSVGQHGSGGQILDFVALDAFLGGDGFQEEDFLFCDFFRKNSLVFCRNGQGE